MESDSIIKGALRSSVYAFCKVFAGMLAFLMLIVGMLSVMTPEDSMATTLTMQPNHLLQTRPFSQQMPSILHIPIMGTIGIRQGITKEQILTVIQDIHKLDLKPGMLKAIILHIDSPGGTVVDANVIFQLIMETKRRFHIPVFAYTDGFCASGGFMIALAADKIIASPQSWIGSVGVISHPAFNVASTMERLGIQAKTLYAGHGKDEGSPFRPWKNDELHNYQQIINHTYDRFVAMVAARRPRLSEEQIRDHGAKVFLGQEALEAGFVDQLQDSYFQALETVAKTLDIEENYQVFELRPHYPLSSILGLQSKMQATMNHTIEIPGELPKELSGKLLYLYQ